jgi:hypothetical protein
MPRSRDRGIFFLSEGVCVAGFGLIASRLAPTLECVLPVGASLLAMVVLQSLHEPRANKNGLLLFI